MRVYIILYLLVAIGLRAAELLAPDGYDVRDLGPLGGQVLVPNGWFFNSFDVQSGPVYTISKEDSSAGYDTGMRQRCTKGMIKPVVLERKGGGERAFREKKGGRRTGICGCAPACV